VKCNSIDIKTDIFKDGRIVQTTDIMGSIMEQVIRTRDAQVREALIALGWTPPKEEMHESH